MINMSVVESGLELAQFCMCIVFHAGGGDSGGMIWKSIWWLMVKTHAKLDICPKNFVERMPI